VMIVPDGMPLVWVGRMQGYEAMRRVTGPDLMLEVFRRKEFATVTHFLYGGREGVADDLRERMKARFPWAQIVGSWMPPFRALTAEEETQLVDRMRVLKPDILWVGISCPKQEQFMFRYLPLLQTKLMFGVGAAFDYHAGRIRDSAPWVKRAGLQWLHRLWQDPRRLWRRYLRNNSAFLWRLALQAAGLRRYPDACVSPMRVVSERHTSEVHSS
jgi:N-acetylglucosaminyldiphosphoundecaprenol N-acetyl-beta-D-mannosaminyltransferase